MALQKKHARTGPQSQPAKTAAEAARLARFSQTPSTNRYLELRQGREALRQKYIEQGLIPDPNQRTSLDKAIKFVGTCVDMCPEFEREEREYQKNIDKFERIPFEENRIDHKRAVKCYRRSAAGIDQPLPCDVRPPPVLESTLSYLLSEIMMRNKLEDCHAFLRDRMRAIRQDYTLQNERGQSAIMVHEIIARFHILSTHLMCEVPGFSLGQEMEQLRKVLQSLQEFYNDARDAGVECPSGAEAEFRSYYLLAHLGDKDVLREAQYYPEHIYNSPYVQHALRFHALFRTYGKTTSVNMARFFQMVAQPTTSFLMACILENYFIHVRKLGLHQICSSISYKPPPSWPIDHVMNMFGFADEDELKQFFSYYNQKVEPPKVIFNKISVSYEYQNKPLTRRMNKRLVTSKMENPHYLYTVQPWAPASQSLELCKKQLKYLWPPSLEKIDAGAIGGSPSSDEEDEGDDNDMEVDTPGPSTSAKFTFGQPIRPGHTLPLHTTPQPAPSLPTNFTFRQPINPGHALPSTMHAAPSPAPSLPTNFTFRQSAGTEHALSSTAHTAPQPASSFPTNFTFGQPVESSKNVSGGGSVTQFPTTFTFGQTSQPNHASAPSVKPPPPTTGFTFQPATLPSTPAAAQNDTTPKPLPPIKEASEHIVEGIIQQILMETITATHTQCKEQYEERVVESSHAVCEQLLDDILTEQVTNTIETCKREAERAERIATTSKTIAEDLISDVLCDLVKETLAEIHAERYIMRRALSRWRNAYLARERARAEQRRREEIFRANMARLRIGPTTRDYGHSPLIDKLPSIYSNSTQQLIHYDNSPAIDDHWYKIPLAEMVYRYWSKEARRLHKKLLWQLSVISENTTATNWIQTAFDHDLSHISILIQEHQAIWSDLQLVQNMSAILYVATPLDGVDLNQPEDVQNYLMQQCQHIQSIAPSTTIPILMIFWANHPEDTTFLTQAGHACLSAFKTRRILVVSNPQSTIEFEQHLDWLVEKSKPTTLVQPHELARDFTDIYRWACNQVAKLVRHHTSLLESVATHGKRKRTVLSKVPSYLSCLNNTYFTFLIDLFNQERIVLKHVYDYFMHHTDPTKDTFFFNYHLSDQTDMQASDINSSSTNLLQKRLSQLAINAPWTVSAITTAQSVVFSNDPIELMTQIFRDIETLFIKCIEDHLSKFNVPFYFNQHHALLVEAFRTRIQSLIQHTESTFERYSIQQLDSSATIKKSRITTTDITHPEPIQHLKSLIDDVEHWLNQSNST